MENSMLLHYGIKGMKWGVRRYQNKDGTLTAKGKARYDGNGNAKTDSKPSTSTQKSRSRMSDEELGKRIQRLEKETRLKDLEKKNIDSGKEYARDILKDVGKRVITTAATGAILYGTKALVSHEFNLRDLANAVFHGGAKKK